MRSEIMRSEIAYPPSVELALLPTPLQPLERLSAATGWEILCKRDDLTGCTLTGNKVRKLEFLLSEALDGGHRGVITCGGEQSNHARATAIAARRMGLGCELLLRTADPDNPPVSTGNLLLCRATGAEVRWIGPEQYRERDALMKERADQLQSASGDAWHVIPEGGSNARGAWGYVRCAAELAEQLGDRPATVIYATGSGGTAAGLIAGCRLLDLPYRLVGICVCDDRPTFQRRIAAILAEMAENYEIDVAVEPEGVEIWDDYVGLGYALSRDEELRCILRLARDEGVLLDPVYSGKAMYGLLCELDRGERLQPGPIVFLHTGGIYGLFPKVEQLAPLLDSSTGSDLA